MTREILSVIARSETLLEDFAGAASLAALLVAGLYLPALV